MLTPQQSPQRRRLIQAAAAAVCGLATASTGLAQPRPWPSRSIRIVVGFAPGGTTDVMARVMGDALREALGEPVVIDNRPGAGGNLAASEVIRADADGYTFLIAPTSFETINPFLLRQTLNPARDLTPVAGIGRSQMYLVIKPQFTFRDAREFVAYARANPGKLSYASAGVGTPPHLAGELFNRATGIVATHIPFRGAAPALQAVMGNQVDFVLDPGISFPHVRAGTLRLLAVASSTRSSFFPEIPTLDQLGFTGSELDIWFGMWAPNGTPAHITARMTTEIAKALAQAQTRTRYELVGAEPVGLNNAEFRALLRSEATTLSNLIREANIRIE